MAQDAGQRVLLYIYDLSQGLARSLSPQLIGRQIDGIWHTSVVCYGYEFYYGQGIFITDRVGQTQYGTPIEIKDMGMTELPEEVFIEYIESLRDIYTAEKYHLLENNCNTFTNDVCQFLVGKAIPGHISGLPEDFLNTPFGQSLRPLIDGTFASRSGRQQNSFTHPPPVQNSQISASQTQQTVHFPQSSVEFNTLISSSNLAIAFFTSETCGPCKMVEPHYHSLSKTHTNIKFIQVDTHKSYSIAQLHQITATPTFKTFLKGQLYAEWKGANPSSLDANLARLIEASRPPLPPSLRGNYSQSPILFSRAPPMEKVVPKLPAGVFPKPLLESISTFLTAKGNIDVLIPPLSAWANVQRGLDYSVENAWMVLDLLRATMADRRISGWFAIDGLETLAEIVRTVNSRDEGEWQLRVVAAQLISNMFSTPLLTIANLRPFLPEMIELLTSSVLASGSNSTTKLVKAAASALFNLSRTSLEESVTPTEDETISIVVALVESLKTLVEKDSTETKELLRLLVVCLGGSVILGRDSDTVKEVLAGIEAAEILRKVDGAVALEVISLIEG